MTDPKALASSLHAQIVDLRPPAGWERKSAYGALSWNDDEKLAYKIGHRDARHAAAELVSAALASSAPAVAVPTQPRCQGCGVASTAENTTGERGTVPFTFNDTLTRCKACGTVWNSAGDVVAPAVAAVGQQPDTAMRDALEALMRARHWHNGDAWRKSKCEENRGAWRIHCENLDMAIASLRAALSSPAPAAPQHRVPDDVWEALQRLIENGLMAGPASREDARLVANWRGRFIADRDGSPAPAAGADQPRPVTQAEDRFLRRAAKDASTLVAPGKLAAGVRVPDGGQSNG